MVADQHRLADPVLRAQPAGGVGEHDGAHAGRGRRPHVVHDRRRRRGPRRGGCGRGTAAPGGRRRGPRGPAPPCPAAVGAANPGSSADGDRGLGRPERVGGRGPARAHHDGDVGAAAEGGGQGVGGGGRGRRRVGAGRGWGTVTRRQRQPSRRGRPRCRDPRRACEPWGQRGPSPRLPQVEIPFRSSRARQPRRGVGAAARRPGDPRADRRRGRDPRGDPARRRRGAPQGQARAAAVDRRDHHRRLHHRGRGEGRPRRHPRRGRPPPPTGAGSG